jgi:nicotinamide riboside kinase
MFASRLFALGGTNTGKSILAKALKHSLGDYVDGFNAENLAYKTSCNVEAQNKRWAMLLRY